MFNTKERALARRTSLLAALMSSAFVLPAMAQVVNNQPAITPTASNQALSDQDIETVVVTGTSIRGVAPVGSNLITFSQQDIQNTGGTNITQILADMPSIESMGTAGRAAASQSNGGPGTAVYIHQLGANGSNSTLVLLDGHRLPWSGVTNYFVDPNNIPQPMIQRIEVLAEGASAVYGSDAVAGVVNFITRTRFDGLQFNAQGSYAPGTHTFQASTLAGKTWDGGAVVGAISYTTESQLKDTSRPWTNPLVQPERAAAAGLSGPGATNFGNFNCDPATLQPGGAGNIFLNAAATSSVANTAANSPCSNWQNGALLPDAIRENGMVKLTQQITPRLTFTGDAVYSQRSSKQIQSRGTLTATAFGPAAAATGQNNPFYQTPAGYTGTATSEQIRYDFDQLLGPGALSLGGDTDMHASGTLSYNVDDNWEIDFLGVGGRDDDFAGDNVGTVNSAQALLALNGTTNTGGSITQSSVPGYNSITRNSPLTTANALDVWNPAATNQTSAAVRSALTDNNNVSHGVYSLEEYNLSAQGSPFSLWAGPIKVAFGLDQLDTEIYEFGTRPENSAGASVASQLFQYDFNRKDTAEFAEAHIPLVSRDMGVSFIQNFEVDLAIRHDNYTDFGATTNPKASFNWDIIDGLRVRGNISTSFVAPPLNLVGGTTGLANFSSAAGGGPQGSSVLLANYPNVAGVPGVTCSANGSCAIGQLQGINISIGDSKAIAQRGHGWSIGTDYSPSFIPNLTTSATLWNTTLIGGMTAPQFGARVTTASLLHDLTFYPGATGATAAQIAAFVGSTPQTGVFPSVVNFTYLSDTSNYLTFYAQGVDLSVDYHYDTDVGTFKFHDDLTEMTKFDEGFAYKVAPTPAQTFSALNTDGFASAFPSIGTQMRARVGWENWGFMADLYMNWTGAYRNVNGTAVVLPVNNPAGVFNGTGGDHVNANITFDLHLGYEFDGGELGADEINFEILNMFDKLPPYYNSSNGYDNLVASPIGRELTLSFTTKF